jgi:hypothetical protein
MCKIIFNIELSIISQEPFIIISLFRERERVFTSMKKHLYDRAFLAQECKRRKLPASKITSPVLEKLVATPILYFPTQYEVDFSHREKREH